MPRFDKTGPEGEGPMTGRRMGKCTNYGGKGITEENDSPNNVLPGRGQGRGPGIGQGKGQGHGLGKGLGRGPGKGRGLGLQNRNRGGNQ